MTILSSARRSSILGAIQRSLTAGVVLFGASSAWAAQTLSGTVPTGGGPPPPRNAPEINPALLVGAVVLVVGCILILTSRRRRVASSSHS